MTETIFALATAPGRAAVGVVRISGPGTRDCVRQIAGHLPRPRQAGVRRLVTPQGTVLDAALVLWFPSPASYTGEDVAEFHVHGGVAVISALLQTLSDQGLRLAEPGEFTRRAFENGKLDLAQAEGIADLIDAETDAQRQQALDQLQGALGRAQQGWRERLLDILAMLEAAVDFPDEDLPADVSQRTQPGLTDLIRDLEAALDGVKRAGQVRDGYKIALIGAPNAGKSTLLNALAHREAAIVTAQPGTTRDVIEVALRLGGYKVILGDTAGLRDTIDEIEVEGIRRARHWAEAADLRIWVTDGSSDLAALAPDGLRAGDLCLITKSDLPAGAQTPVDLVEARALGLEVHRLSARRPADVAALELRLTERAVEAMSTGELPTATNIRHADWLAEAALRLRSALALQDAPELAAEDVRLAARALDRITGRMDPEEVLGRVFATFCIGK